MPARSPIPFIVTCTHCAPACITDIALATASPKSLWQCTLIGNLVASIASFVISAIYCGVEYPTVSGISILSAPLL